MIENKLVSVVMPSFNSERYVSKSIKSALAQTHENLELVFVDDGSTDSSLKIVEEFSREDSRVKIFPNSFAKGASGARNCGVYNAKGFYIAFLDSDDLWHPEKLATQLRFMHERNISFCYSDYEMFMENPDRKKLITCPPRVVGTDILKKCDIGCLTVVLEASLLPETPFQSIHKEDYALWVDLIYNKGREAFNCCNCLAYYRKLNDSRSGAKMKELRKQFYVLRNTGGLSWISASAYLLSYGLNGISKHRY